MNRRHLAGQGLTRKLLLGFGGVMVVLLVMTALVVALLTSNSAELQAIHHENYDSVRYCEGMREALDRAHTIAQSYISGQAGAPGALESAREDFEKNASDQLANTTLPGELELTQRAVQSGQAVFDQTAALAGTASGDRSSQYREKILPALQNCHEALSDISQLNLDNLVRVNADVRSALLATRTTVILLLLIGLALSGAVILLTAGSIIQPLTQLIRLVREIERGNLDALVETASNDEIGELTQAFNEMAAKLREFRRLDLERLSRTQQTTQAAIDSLPDAVAVLNLQGTIEISNHTAQVHFRLVPGKDIHSIRPDWAAAFFAPVIETRQAVTPDGYGSAIQLFDESGERFLLPRAVPMFDAAGTLIGVTLALAEITHLRKADEFKSGLLSTVSHELKTPLTSIRMAIRLLLDNRIGNLNERQQKLVDAAKVDAERLVGTVEDILTIRRVEAGRAHLDLQKVSVQEILQSAIATVESGALERNVRIVQNAAEGHLQADPILVSCALANLLSNAVKFSPGGAAVTVEVSREEGQIAFAVRDQGAGIPAEYHGRIFEKFFRIATPDGPTGAGLGLSIAAEIAQLHHGSITLSSTPGSGSTFVLRLPDAPVLLNTHAAAIQTAR